MKSWQEKTLSDLGKVARGKSRHRPRNADFLYGGEYPFIQTSDVKHANFRIKEYTQTYSEEGLKQSKLWKKDTLCITIAANIADTAILGIDACFPDSIMGFVPNENVSDVRFVKYCFDILQKKIQQISQGAAQDNLSLEKLLTVKFLVPDYPTQRKIASILSAYDDLIENNLKRIKLLEEIAQRTYEEWFVKFRINCKQLKLNKETGLPEGWTFGSLKELVSFQNGFAFKSSKFTAEGQPVIKIKNIGNNTIDVTNTDCVDEDYAKTAEKFQVNEGDLLIAMTGATVGKVGYLPYSVKKCYLNQRVGRFINLKGSSNIHFVFSVMTQGSGLQQVLNLASGAAQPNISGDQILSLQTVIPTSDLLKNFNEIAETNIKQILTLLNQNRLLKESRDILLPRLMSGVIEVKA